MSRVRTYCFIYKNYTDEGKEILKKWLTANTKYAIFAYELENDNGISFLKGCLSLNIGKTITAMRKSILIGMIVQLTVGTIQENRQNYIKNNNYWEYGNVKSVGRGARSDLLAPIEDIYKGINIEEVMDRYPLEYMKYYRGLDIIANEVERRRVPDIRELNVTLLYGESGSGKSYYCRKFCEKYNLESYTFPHCSKQRWNGYNRQQVLIIDDFYGWIKYSELLIILDPYKYEVETKRGYKYVLYEEVLITSNRHYSRWYNKENDKEYDEGALDRRIDNVYFCSICNGETMMIPEKECNELIFSE